jgi:hypothetical protein
VPAVLASALPGARAFAGDAHAVEGFEHGEFVDPDLERVNPDGLDGAPAGVEHETRHVAVDRGAGPDPVQGRGQKGRRREVDAGDAARRAGRPVIAERAGRGSERGQCDRGEEG